MVGCWQEGLQPRCVLLHIITLDGCRPIANRGTQLQPADQHCYVLVFEDS